MTVIDADTHVVEDVMIWDYVSQADAAYKPVSVTADEVSNLAYSSGERQFWLIDGDLYGRGGQPGPMYGEGTRTLGDPTARVADMDRYGHDVQVTGQADVALTSVSPDEFDAVRAIGGHVFSDRIPAVVSLAFNTVKDTPFRDRRVREAVIHAVDRQSIVDILLGGETVVANQPAPRSAFGYNETLRPRLFDSNRARRLLRTAGYENGFSAVMEMPSGAVMYTDVFQKW